MCMSLQTPVLDVGSEDKESNDNLKREVESLAEQWRLNPCFEHDEVTMTRLGEL